MLITTAIVSLLLILRNMLLRTIISSINFIEQFLIQHCNISVNGFSSVIQLLCSDKRTKIWTPPPPYLNLLDFGNPPFCKRFSPFQYHHYPIVKSCYFIDSWTPVIISIKMPQKIFPWYECSQYSHKYKWCLLLRLRYG